MMKLNHSHLYYYLPPFLPRIAPAAYHCARLHTVPETSAIGLPLAPPNRAAVFFSYRHQLHRRTRHRTLSRWA
jgi:hypothetical protein